MSTRSMALEDAVRTLQAAQFLNDSILCDRVVNKQIAEKQLSERLLEAQELIKVVLSRLN